MEEQDAYRVKLEVFEGPMDLLLHLIRKNDIDIYDIPIALITQQYIEYIEIMKQLNLDVAGEFIVLASELMYIKSRMLLPKSEEDEDPEDEGPDPREELVRRLIEYQQYKEVADQLRERDLLGRDVFTRGATARDWVDVQDNQLAPTSLFSLVEAFQKLLQKVPPGEVNFTVDRISVRQRIIQLMDVLKGKQSIAFDELFEKDRNRRDLIITFLAVLEMVRLAVLKVHQAEMGESIRLFPTGVDEAGETIEQVKDDYS